VAKAFNPSKRTLTLVRYDACFEPYELTSVLVFTIMLHVAVAQSVAVGIEGKLGPLTTVLVVQRRGQNATG